MPSGGGGMRVGFGKRWEGVGMGRRGPREPLEAVPRRQMLSCGHGPAAGAWSCGGQPGWMRKFERSQTAVLRTDGRLGARGREGPSGGMRARISCVFIVNKLCMEA